MRKLTKEEFISKACEKHNGKYDYSKVDYVNAITKVTIRCLKHGEFEQKPSQHLSGQGCFKCSKCIPSTEEWIDSAHKVHKGKYNYSKVKYVNAKTKVCIICPEHGEFWQVPSSHLNGNGCPKCSGCYVPTTEEFIKKAKETHKDKYDYSKVEYVSANTKVCIICHEHGEFWQTPSNHIQGAGCPKCANEATGERCRSSLSDFITKSSEVHGQKYEYTKVNYVNTQTKVCIICPEHGEFWQTPNHHLRGQGCPTCGIEKNNEKIRSTTENFIKKAHLKHCNKYDYSKVHYVNNYTKVIIICPEHGEFEQRPNDHLNGAGCPKCGGNYSPTKEEWIDLANEIHNGKYDYSKVNYMNNHTKVCIICPEHGGFWQRADHHLRGQGCPKCANEANSEYLRSSLCDFITKSRKAHGDKYDYSKVEYVNCETKVCIICPEHGEFWQIPSTHVQGAGCHKCSGCYVPTTEEWITSAREVHGGKYDYSKVVYVGSKVKVYIICPEHGEFEQRPNDHLNGSACPKCSKCIPTKEEWIAAARKKHGNKYDYSKVKYVNNSTKLCIICPEHGEFEQTPYAHLSGQGCPKCNLSHLERSVMNYLDGHGITYDYQKRFKWLGRQSLDFYLPDYNVGIECQGGQHFFPVEHFGGDKGFKKTLERDKRKKSLCEEHGVNLLYFGDTPNYDTFLGEVVHDDVKHLIDYLQEHKIDRDKPTTE